MAKIGKGNIIALSITVLMLILMTIAGIMTEPLRSKETSEAIEIAENALINKQTVFVGYADVTRLNYLYNEFVKSELPDERSNTPEAHDLFAFLQKVDNEGLPLLKQAEELLLVANAKENLNSNTEKDTQKEAIETILVITGQFNVEQTIKAFEKHMLAFPLTENAAVYRITPAQNIETCAQGEPFDMYVDKESIIITPEGALKGTLKTLAQNKAQPKDILNWKAYREGKLMALAILNPNRAIENVTNPFANMFIRGKKEEIESFKKAFASVDLSIISQSLSTNLQVWTTAENAQKNHEKLSASIEGVKAFIPEEPAEMADYKNMLNNLQSSVNGNLWEFNLSLGESELNSLKELPKNLGKIMMSSMSGMKSNTDDENSNSNPDVLVDESNITIYQNNVDIDKLNTAILDVFSNKKGFKVGPFMISPSVEPFFSFGQKKEPTDDLERIYVQIESGIIPNMNISMHGDSENPRVQLFIQKVADHSGQNILNIETCGPNRTAKAVELTAMPRISYEGNEQKRHTTVSGKRELKLLKGHTQKQAKTVEGYIQLRIPSMIKTVDIPAKEGETYSFKGTNFTITKSSYGELGYTIEGQKDLVLDVMPLNKDKKVIEANSKSSSGNNITQYPSGTPVFARLILASQEQERTFSFKAPVKQLEE